MPSASAKIEKIAAAEAADPIKQFHVVLEKKVRNLEKRKLKLDNYKSDVKNGKELNEDQKNAVNKYDQVVELLEYSKELCKSLNTITMESMRMQKKLAKKEQIERQQYEIQRLQEAFSYRHILSCLENEVVRNDFLNGENGAIKMSPEDLHCLDQLYKLIGPSLPNDQADVESYFHVLAENFIFLVEGKNKEVAGTTYKALKELLLSIKQSGYFSKPAESIDEVSSDDAPELEEHVAADDTVENPVPEEDSVPNSSPDAVSYAMEDSAQVEVADTACVQEPLVGEAPILPSAEEEEEEDVAYAGQKGSLQEVLASQGCFNFLQESQIELDTPHMDPAVVAVHQMPPPSAINYPVAVTSYTPAPSEEDPHKVSNSTEHVSPPMTQQAIPVMTSVPQTVPSVLTSVPHNSTPDFDPTHPIPTQTFTNQSFAVMQNMIMPPTYVPVTMHHGPLPPHITPIAVVPGLSPPVSTPASAVPIHVAVTSVPVSTEASPAIITSVEQSNAELENEEQEHLGMNGNASGPEASSTQNNTPGEKMSDPEGFTTQNSYQRGYRGRGRGRGSTNGFFRGRGYNGRGGYQNNYYQGNFRRGGTRGGGRGNGGNMRGGRGTNYRSQTQ